MDQYRKTPRAKFLNYETGEYFVTICTLNKKHYFGYIGAEGMVLSRIGEFVDRQLRECNSFYPDLIMRMHVVMPNHIHFMVYLKGEQVSNNAIQRSPNPYLRANPTCQRHVPTLSKYISSLKGSVSKYAKSLGLEFGWQARYHDHYIRGEKDGRMIGEYITNNISRWKEDCFNVKNEIQI